MGLTSSMSQSVKTFDGDSFSVMTYNVFFGPHFDEKRYPALLECMKEKDCDFVCLQEVTRKYVDFPTTPFNL